LGDPEKTFREERAANGEKGEKLFVRYKVFFPLPLLSDLLKHILGTILSIQRSPHEIVTAPWEDKWLAVLLMRGIRYVVWSEVLLSKEWALNLCRRSVLPQSLPPALVISLL